MPAFLKTQKYEKQHISLLLKLLEGIYYKSAFRHSGDILKDDFDTDINHLPALAEKRRL